MATKFPIYNIGKDSFTTIEHGRPITFNRAQVDKKSITDLPEEYVHTALDILSSWFLQATTVCKNHSSYIIKHWLESALYEVTEHKVDYISNNQLKDAMPILGFRPQKTEGLNWLFKIKPTKELKEWLKKRGMYW